MCGIAGIVSSGKNNELLVGHMLNSERHRGPDDDGIWSASLSEDRRLTLGHRRLAIIDLSDSASQPMLDEKQRFAVTFNGEIYNYLEIRKELVALGADFRSTSDTEVLLKSYQQWGTDCLSRFNGMFAFAIYDSVRRVLFCARDRYGEKPFLFSSSEREFSFASEYKAILLNPNISLDYDEFRLIQAAHNPSTGLDANRQTLFNSVQQLLPSEAMEVDLDSLRVKIWRYWEITPSEPEDRVEADVFAEFRELLIDSVKLRLRSDVPVGSCLSGGLDSSAIVGIVRNLLGSDVKYHTFTGVFPGTDANEWQFAKQVIDMHRVESHTVEPSVDLFIENLGAFCWDNELPVSSSSQFAQWCVFRLAKENGVTVLLDGQGADECLGGYEQYFARYLEALTETGDNARARNEFPLIRSRYPLALSPPSRSFRDKLPFRTRHWLSNKLNIGTSLLYGLKPEIATRISRQSQLHKIAGFNSLANSLVQDSFGRFLTTLLRYGDRNSMAHSREVRLPFCDHRIAEFVFRLPPHLLMGDVQTKRLLRESMRGLLPEPIRERWNKQGFRPPQNLWFESPKFLELVKDVFSSRNFRTNGHWIPGWWDRVIRRVESGESGLGWVLWQPFMIAQWKFEFLDKVRQQREELLCV